LKVLDVKKVLHTKIWSRSQFNITNVQNLLHCFLNNNINNSQILDEYFEKDFFLWGTLKSVVYGTSVENVMYLNVLENKIDIFLAFFTKNSQS